jgi:hypothetical protein
LVSEGLILPSSACSSRFVLGVLHEYGGTRVRVRSKRACALEYAKIRLLGSQAIRKIANAGNWCARCGSRAEQRSAAQNP